MKRILKIILPILLVITILCSVAWYLTKYDRDFTRDMLVSHARNFELQGNHTVATWLYDLAYRHSGNDETVALELAQQYRSMGNYTKAEYTLSNAIADGGTAQVYIALCNLYVEQNKLLDAVTMLDSISDQSVKTQLDALRPQAPTPSHNQGYYNQYITLSLTVPDGTVYFTTDGLYPSTDDAHYTTPITLPAGETTVHALTVGENGLVSPLCIWSYTVAGVIEEVTIEDAAIDRVIRQQLQVGDDHTLYTNELWTITSLAIPKDAQSLSDLSKLPFLIELSIDQGSFDSLSPLSALTTLQKLVITDTTVSDDDLNTIASLPRLTKLTMTGCSLSGITPLSGATGLTYLDLGNNTIRDLTALESIPDLTYLSLTHNAVTDLTSLEGLVKLNALDLSYNSITSTAPLAGCTALTILDVTGNNLTALEGLDQLTKLQALSVAFNKLTDVNLLAANTSLTVLDISNNSITDISALSRLNKLFNLNFSYNQVSKLPTFSKDCALVSIKGSQNQLTSLEELAGLENLNTVMMDHNAGITSIDALTGCYALVEVSVYGTAVTDASALTDLGVIVKYKPF